MSGETQPHDVLKRKERRKISPCPSNTRKVSLCLLSEFLRCGGSLGEDVTHVQPGEGALVRVLGLSGIRISTGGAAEGNVHERVREIIDRHVKVACLHGWKDILHKYVFVDRTVVLVQLLPQDQVEVRAQPDSIKHGLFF